MNTIVEKLNKSLIELKKELERRQNVYAWGSEVWKYNKKKGGGVRYSEDTDILKESISELTETISNLELLTKNNFPCTQI